MRIMKYAPVIALAFLAGCSAVGTAPSDSPPAVPPASQAPALSFTCDVTRTGTASGGYPYAAFTVTVTGPADTSLTFVNVVFYSADGSDAGSDHLQVSGNGTQFIPAGQSVTFDLGFEYGQPDQTPGVSSCQVVSYS